MIFSDLPSPAEASNEEQTIIIASRRRETGIHPRIKSEDRLFRDHALRRKEAGYLSKSAKPINGWGVAGVPEARSAHVAAIRHLLRNAVAPRRESDRAATSCLITHDVRAEAGLLMAISMIMSLPLIDRAACESAGRSKENIRG
jgi:hypothetical protein